MVAAAHFEFGGPRGAVGIAIGLPCMCYALHFACDTRGCVRPWDVAATLPDLDSIPPLWSWEAFGVYIGWVIACAVLHIALPATEAKGQALADGYGHLTYRLNGFVIFLIATLGSGGAAALGLLDLAWLHRNELPLLSASLVFSFAASTWLYHVSFDPRPPTPMAAGRRQATQRQLAAGGNSASAVYNWFIGRELNPRVLGGRFDLKVFCELVPGLTGWILMSFSCAHFQAQQNGAVSLAMLLTCAFQWWYGAFDMIIVNASPARQRAFSRRALVLHAPTRRVPHSYSPSPRAPVSDPTWALARPSPLCSRRRALPREGDPIDHGRDHRWLRLHALLWRPLVGPLHVRPPRALPRDPRRCNGAALHQLRRGDHGALRLRLLDLPPR